YLTIMLCCAMFFNLSAQSNRAKVISGTVHSADGKPLPGVTIRLKQLKISTLTDAFGQYSIAVPSDSLQLEFRLIGYEPLNEQVYLKGESE
ncbi:carboxypeptidase-like regulatory domain-containing protein, partial [Stenotrophomonas maltophilia]